MKKLIKNSLTSLASVNLRTRSKQSKEQSFPATAVKLLSKKRQKGSNRSYASDQTFIEFPTTTWRWHELATFLGVYNDQQEADSLNEPNSLQEPVSSPEYPGVGGKSRNSRFATGKSFFGQFLNSGGTTPTPDMFSSEPFSQFWVTLSNVYGQALVILMFAFSLTEVMDNSVKLLSLQGIFLMYFYVGSIAVIICIYVWVLIDYCSNGDAFRDSLYLYVGSANVIKCI